VDGRKIEGTDQVSTSLFIGASSIVAPRVLLDVTAGIGLTEDAPDYSITVSLPIRFDLPLSLRPSDRLSGSGATASGLTGE
jgi:hypothetical protein